MLVSICCSNYTCHFCINDLKEQEKKDCNFKAACPFGCQHTADGDLKQGCTYLLRDVDPNDKIKKYSDSQHAISQKPEEEKDYFDDMFEQAKQDLLSPAVNAVLGLS